MKKRMSCLLLLATLLTSCKTDKAPFSIPAVDVTTITLNLPDKPTYNVGNIAHSNDNTIDYIDVYELSDFHGAVDSDGENQIGLAKLSTYLKGKRALNPGGTIIISAGDMYQGSIESNLTRGYIVNYAMNYMGFDAMTIGNHEFDWGTTWIENNKNLTYGDYKIPFLGANIYKKGNNEQASELADSHIVINRGEYKIGLVGTIGSTLESSILKTSIKNHYFGDELAALRREKALLNDCNFTMWASHNDVESLSKLPLTVEDDIAVTFGGHAHINVKEFADTLPTKYVATAANGTSVAHARIGINKTTKKVASTYVEIEQLNSANYNPDADVLNMIGQYTSKINAAKQMKLGKSTGYFNKGQNLPNLAVESMQESVVKFVGENQEAFGIDPNRIIASYHNTSGGIRDDLSKGEITYGNVYSIFPFDNEIVLKKLTGEKYKKYLGPGSKSFSTLAVCHTYKKTSEIKSSEDYYIAINDYVALGYLGFNEEEIIRTGLLVRDEVARNIYEKDKMNPDNYSSSVTKFKFML